MSIPGYCSRNSKMISGSQAPQKLLNPAMVTDPLASPAISAASSRINRSLRRISSTRTSISFPASVMTTPFLFLVKRGNPNSCSNPAME